MSAKGPITQVDIITAYIGDIEIDRIYSADELVFYQLDPEALLTLFIAED